MIVSLGTDCIVSMFCDKYKLRNMSLPFDWCVSYNGVSKCFEEDFIGFVDTIDENRINKYDVYFHHDFQEKEKYNLDSDKYIRRCARLLELLKNSEEELIFVRSGHSCHHHDEHNRKYNKISNDIDDIECLDVILSNKYPKLKYRIVIMLSCNKCFNPQFKYESKRSNIEIYNISAEKFDLQQTHVIFTTIFNDYINEQSAKYIEQVRGDV